MKIVSWNINGYRSITGQNPSKRFDNVTYENKLFNYIDQEKPDIICLQETKVDENQIYDELKAPPWYFYYYSHCSYKKGYSGAVTFTKYKPKSVNFNLGINKFDIEGRIVETDFDDFVLLNIYFPNGTSGYHRVEYKLEFYDYLFSYLDKYRDKKRKHIVCGDYNTAHKEIDLARPKENEGNSGFLPEERKKIDEIIELGYIDTFRIFNQEGGNYTWWSQRGRARQKNIGWRIDYFFVDGLTSKLVKDSIIQPTVLGSDHCPIILDIDL
jgi:exodeoxyribonuclease-3